MNAVLRERLKDDHRRVAEEIDRLLLRRWIDPDELQRLKKQKLAIKDRLHRIGSVGRLETEAA